MNHLARTHSFMYTHLSLFFFFFDPQEPGTRVLAEALPASPPRLGNKDAQEAGIDLLFYHLSTIITIM